MFSITVIGEIKKVKHCYLLGLFLIEVKKNEVIFEFHEAQKSITPNNTELLIESQQYER